MEVLTIPNSAKPINSLLKIELQDDGLVGLVELLQSIVPSGLAKINVTSISDNNGGRILL